MIRTSCSFIAFALVLGLASPLRAEEEPRKAAGAHYQKGLELANRAEYRAALDEFNAAYAASPNFAVLYNIGQAEVAIGRPRQAIESLTKYLRDGGEQVPATRRQQVELQLKELKGAFAYLSVTTKPDGALVNVDGANLASTPLAEPLRLTPGSHIVAVSRQGFSTESLMVAIAEGQQQTLNLELRPLGANDPGLKAGLQDGTERPVSTPEPRPTPPTRAADRSSFPTPYVLMGAGVAVGGVALAHYFWNAGRADDFRATDARLRNETVPGRRQLQLENNELAESIDRASVVTVGLGVASGVLVAGGAVWLVGFSGDAGSDSASVRWRGTW
jgi:tetratricopeptide (TPR) repeat protein